MAHDIHQGTIARDEYILPQGVLPDTLGRGAVEREAAMTNCNLTAITHVIQKRPFQSPLEVRDVKKPRSKALQFICCMPECAEKFNSREHLETHMKLHLGVKPFTCDVCGKVCQTESKLKTHQASHANDGFKPKCDICERSFSSRSALNKHKKMLHKPKPHVCLHCNSGFEERKYMVIHAKRAHDVDLPLEVKELQPPTSAVNFEVNNFNSSTSANDCKNFFKGSFCEPITVNLQTLSAPPNQSFDPPKEHSQSDSTMLQKKTDISGAPAVCVPINCELCTSTFPSMAYLEQHMAVHLGEKTFICHNCGISFSNRHDLSNHMKLHTSDSDSANFITTNFSTGSFSQFVPLPTQPGPTRGPQIFDKYICVVCNEQFLNLGSLKRHQAKGHNTAVLSI
ncbi:zinc finger protein 300-like [Homarus americanus]|uniref:zinc finger protein 300-like n=1 Tax=Homarus americanus TaxID=6706 RepID=UPI001C438C1D|nr:zinc finger protein 300-like [Homarus americanus]